MRRTLMITLLVLASLIPPRAEAGESPQFDYETHYEKIRHDA